MDFALPVRVGAPATAGRAHHDGRRHRLGRVFGQVLEVRWLPECPDEFVVGYGMDYDEQYRTLGYVGVLKASVYSP